MDSSLTSIMARDMDRLAALVRRFVRWQTPFSVVSALVPLMLVIVFAVDLLIGHPGIHRRAVTLWLALYLVATLLPLVLGRRYPLWAGLLVVAGMEAWSSYFLVFSDHSHAEINALLELPLVALYVAWFYPAAVAWAFIVLSMLRVSVTLIWHPELGTGIGSPVIMIGYALIIMLFCFEGARAVRRQLTAQANVDAMTSALNRRGLAEAGPRAVRLARRAGEPLSVAVVDFDDFKRVNDLGGHAAGDAALRESVSAWSAMLGMRGYLGRGRGFVVRLGGDEFALVGRLGAGELGSELNRLHDESPFNWSWGVVAVQPGEGLNEAIANADAELYRARRARRGDG
ncbi:GGDEF domain-containing protein [Leucobacter tenebrionis]|uniref:GGDEF domain-containing protein n=1 Tax=Leucobacter tenebrionis TaxID=2873270 RepID=UPI001CA78531|nr:GGDEF domain-containing protein [Leucobacter tenebrionis]QZY52738.1 GGDEF domain-containing protein [Leucobacter tenebrionis]